MRRNNEEETVNQNGRIINYLIVQITKKTKQLYLE